MRYLLFLLLTICGFTTLAQSGDIPANTKQIEFVGNSFPPDTKAFFVAEIHGFHDLDDFEFKLMEYLLIHHQLKHVVLERGNAYAYLLNQYMQKGDTTYLKYYNRGSGKLDYFERFRALYHLHPFTIHGIDFERLEFVAAVTDILSKNAMGKNTDLYKYLSTMVDSVTHIPGGEDGRGQRTDIYRHAKKLYKQDKAVLVVAAGSDATVLGHIFTNPASERHMRHRNVTMFTNFRYTPDLGSENFLCILGARHNAANSKGSFLGKCIQRHAANNAVINMVCKNCDTRSYFSDKHVDFSAEHNLSRIAPQLNAAYDQLSNPGTYPIVDQHSIKGIENNYSDLPTYYVLFKDQTNRK